MTRVMAGPDLVYITRYEHNSAGIFVICIADTSQIVMQCKPLLSQELWLLLLLFTILRYYGFRSMYDLHYNPEFSPCDLLKKHSDLQQTPT